MKIAAVTILYNPDESVIQNIQSYLNYIDKLYLIDNSELINTDIQKKYNSLFNITIIHDGNNKGIANRLNQACDFAMQEGYDYLLTMDQDSFFDTADIQSYFECIKEFNQIKEVAMFGVNHEKKNIKQTCSYKKVHYLITSGSLINLKNFFSIGNFDEKLFIDFVDIDYCFKAVLKGFNVIQFENVFMHHKIGEVSEQRSLKTLKSTTRSIHSSTRLYYMVRNFFYINKKYKNHFKHEIKIIRTDLFHRIKNKLLYNNQKIKLLSLLLKARFDYKNDKMGKQF